MILYHGTNMEFDAIDISKSNHYKDFGRGFYLTDIREQAEQLARKKVRLLGGDPIVQKYEFDESLLVPGTMNVLKFDAPTAEWAEFIFKNRNRESKYRHNYDIVIGPIADDGVAYLLGRYDEGTLSLEELSRELTYKNLNSQFFFGTERALKCLHSL